MTKIKNRVSWMRRCPTQGWERAKPSINCIQKQGGFGWVFKTQMYPLGYEEFVKRLYTRFSLPGDRGRNAGKKKGFPVAVRTELPEKPVALFKKWVSEIGNDPPCIDMLHRCASRGNSPRPGRTQDHGACLSLQP